METKAQNTIDHSLFYKVVEVCSESIMLTDSEGLLIYVNPAWEKLYGYTKDEVLGKKPSILHSGLQDKNFYEQMWLKIDQQGWWRGRLTNKTKDGKLVPSLLTINHFFDSQGKNIGYVGIAIDLTEQELLEHELLRQDRLASVGMIASGLAHEIGTPLGVIRGRAELIQMEERENPVLVKALNVIVNQIDRIHKLIATLLRFARSSDGLQMEPIQLYQVLAEVHSLLEEKFRKAHIEFENSIPKNQVVVADANKMQQIFINLLLNATHAIEERAKSESDFAKQIRVKLSTSNERPELSITDTGCGIAPKNIKKLFQPFYTTKDVGEGTGLGLAIVAKLLTEMKANIRVDSKLGQGTCFTITLNG